MTKPPFPITEHTTSSPRHTTSYLACGPEGGPLVIFVHGWPELSHSWRHQLPALAALGFRAIAPDMRGYGRSSVPRRHEDYALEIIVADMLALLAHLGREKAVWVGHDWGAPVVWAMASHHPEHCSGVAALNVPYLPGGLGPEAREPLIDRTIYPADKYPAGQWEYQLFYVENFEKARTEFEADVPSTVKALFRKGNPAAVGKPSRTAEVRRQGGWFGPLGKAPPVPIDADVISETDLAVYSEALSRNGFFGPDSWYMNHRANAEFASRAKNGGRITMPVLFLHGAYDTTCETVNSRLAEPMRAYCGNLSEAVVASGHWMAQERPVEVNAALVGWLARAVPDAWPEASSKPAG